MGKTGKKPKTNRQKHGMNETRVKKNGNIYRHTKCLGSSKTTLGAIKGLKIFMDNRKMCSHLVLPHSAVSTLGTLQCCQQVLFVNLSHMPFKNMFIGKGIGTVGTNKLSGGGVIEDVTEVDFFKTSSSHGFHKT